MQKMFTDGDAFTKMEKLKNKDRSLWKKIKDFFTEAYNRIREAYKGLEPESDLAEYYLELTEAVREQIANLFSEAVVEAGESFSHISERAMAEAIEKARKKPTPGGGVKYGLRNDNNGNSYWHIETQKDIFKGISNTKDLQQAAYDYVLNGYTGENVIELMDGKPLQFIRVSAKEFIYGTQSKSLNSEQYSQKMRMSASIDDLIKNAQIHYEAPDNKSHKLFTNGFSNYQGRVGIDDTIFRYIVRIGKGKNDEIFYDINLEADGKVPRANRTSLIKTSASVNTTIPQSEHGVNTHSMQNSENDTSEVKYSLRISPEENIELQQKTEMLDQLNAELREKSHNSFVASKKVTELKKSDEYKGFLDLLYDKSTPKDELDEIIAQIGEWQERSGYNKANSEYQEFLAQEKQTRQEISNVEKELHNSLKEQIKEFEEEEIKGYVSKAIRKYHTTSRLDKASYLLTTGSMLDFSDGQGYRVKDHREISEILGLPDYAEYSDGMIAFMNMGNIRLQSYGIDISKAPNEKQISTLRSIISQVMRDNDEFSVDFSKADGYNDGSVTYPKGVSSSRIISDIKEYFATGKIPEYDSGLTQFMYSPRETNEENKTVKQQIANSMETLSKIPAVSSIDISNVTVASAKASAYKTISSFPETVDVKGIGKIITDKKRLQNGLRYIEKPEEYIAYACLQKVLKQGYIINKKENHKDRGYETFTLAAPITFKKNGKDFRAYMAVVVRYEGKNYYKMHRVVFDNLSDYDATKENTLGRLAAAPKVQSTQLQERVFNESITNGDKKVKQFPITEPIENNDTVIDEDEYGIKYQLRPEYTPREALADALEEIAQGRAETVLKNGFDSQEAMDILAITKVETEALERYKRRIEQLNKDEELLKDIRRQIYEISFTPGSDRSELTKLINRRKILEDRINRQDKELLSLESTKVFKDIVTKEKKVVAQREKVKAAQRIAEVKRERDKMLSDMSKKHAQSKKNAKNSRDRTEIRHKILKRVKELNKLLLNGDKEHHVPQMWSPFVAQTLAAVNMDTVNAEQRLAEKQAEISEVQEKIANTTSPEKLAALQKRLSTLQKEYNTIEAQGEVIAKRLEAFQEAYAEFKGIPSMEYAYDKEIADKLSAVRKDVGFTPLRDMTLSQLEEVNDLYKAVLHLIRNANKTFKAEKQASIAQLGTDVMREVEQTGGSHEHSVAALRTVNKFGISNLKPVTAMKVIGSSTFESLFDNVRKGEDTWAVDVTEAKDFFKTTAEKYNYDGWDFENSFKFTDSNGKTFYLNLQQIMSLFAFSRRKQATEHLTQGGDRSELHKQIQ